VPIAFETKHDIDKVLKQFRSRECAFLCDVTDEYDAAARRLRERDEVERAATKLGDRARRSGHVGAVHKLDRVDEYK
jgi:hypothetical protein